jgi:hypothetical protein
MILIQFSVKIATFFMRNILTLNYCEVPRRLKKTLTRFFSESKTIAEAVLYKIDRDTSQVFN